MQQLVPEDVTIETVVEKRLHLKRSDVQHVANFDRSLEALSRLDHPRRRPDFEYPRPVQPARTDTTGSHTTVGGSSLAPSHR